MAVSELQQRCRALVRELEIPAGRFDLSGLCEHVGRMIGRELELVPMRLPATAPSALWAETTAAADAIFFDSATSWPHQQHSACHELGHLICGHEPKRIADLAASGLTVPHFGAETTGHALGRSAYIQLAEQEAELAGGELYRLLRADGEVSDAKPGNPVVERLRRSLESPPPGD